MPPSADIRFDGWTLRRQSGELLKDGKTIRLQDQPLQILEALLEHPGELVTREQLIGRLWPKGVVDFDTALNTAVRRLRAALRDEAETPRYIETIPRRGYRFIGTVVAPSLPDPGGADERAPSPAGEPSRRGWQRSAAAALLLVLGIGAIVWYSQNQQATAPAPESRPPAAAAVKSIAVLPFVDLSPEQNQQYFADGLSEELLNLLAQIRQLRVTARTSSFSFKGENVDIATVARKLNVTHVIEGSVRKSGDRVRITAQLIDAATSSHLWSQTYDRELNDIFEVQSDIAASVANALQVALEASRPGTGTPRNAQAYERFLQGHFFFHRRAPRDVERAAQYYQQALEIDPDFARAWAGLAGVYWVQITEGAIARNVGLEKLREAAEKALALDPGLAEAHLRLAIYLRSIGDSNAAREHRRKAAALEPDNPLVLNFSADAAAEDGRFGAAIELQQRAVSRDPLSAVNREYLGYVLFLAGRLEEAKVEGLKVLELNPTHPAGIVCFVLILSRQFDQALALVQRRPESEDRTVCLAFAYHGLGREGDADAALRALIESSPTSDPFRIAEVYAYRGETDEAFKWLQTAADKYRGVSWFRAKHPPWALRLSPFLRPLHTDARWDAWVAAAQ